MYLKPSFVTASLWRTGITLILCSALSGVADENAVDSSNVPPDVAKNTAVIAKALEDIAPEGWKPAGPVERYVVTNLYDKIDGRSELYMSYRVKGLAFVTLVNETDESQFIDIFLYDMNSVSGAYGIFSVERWRNQTPLNLGRGGYRTENDLFFWKGPYYASLLGSGPEAPVRDAQKAVAQRLANRLSDSGERLWGLEILPKKDLVADSIQYFMADALSLGFLTDTYTALYRLDSQEVTAFISRADSPKKAEELEQRYVEYMKKYGEQVEPVESEGRHYSVADMGDGRYDAVFRKGTLLGGVTAVPDRALALKSAAIFEKNLKTPSLAQ